MKKLLTLLILVLGISMQAQVYSMNYTHYVEVDTISKQLSKNIPYNTTVSVDYKNSRIMIEDNTTIFPLNIIYNNNDTGDSFYECISNDSIIFKISMVQTNHEYLCIVSSGSNFTRIYKRQR